MDSNSFYSQHWEVVNAGKTVISTTPESLWENAVSYFKWCDEHEIEETRVVTSGKGIGTQVKLPKQRPYSIKGLCLHCGILQEYLIDVKNSKDENSLMYQVVMRILYIIHTQNLENAVVGIFNPIFTAKVLNMESEETPTSPVRVEIIGDLPKLATSESEMQSVNLKK